MQNAYSWYLIITSTRKERTAKLNMICVSLKDEFELLLSKTIT
jgi:hypothetical protein